MIYVWAMGRVEDPQKWSDGLTAPLPGHIRKPNPVSEDRLRKQELDQLRGMIPTPESI